MVPVMVVYMKCAAIPSNNITTPVATFSQKLSINICIFFLHVKNHHRPHTSRELI